MRNQYQKIYGVFLDEGEDIRMVFLESVQTVIRNLDKEDFQQFESDLSAISRKFQKVRLLLKSEDSDELVTSLGNFGVEKHFEGQEKVVGLILEDIRRLLKIVEDDGDIEGPVVKMIRCCVKIKEFFDEKDYRECVFLILKCKKILERTVLGEKMRWKSSVRDNIETYEKIGELINDFVVEGRKLSELSELLDRK